MEILNRIQNFIINNDIENAYEEIIKNEKTYIGNTIYWNLRGMLCFKIQEYDIAISCYKRSIDIQEDNIDAYFNLAYIYKVMGENIKSVLYAGIGLRYTEDIEFIKDINSLYDEETLSTQYKELLNEIKSNLYITIDNFTLFRYVCSHFNNIDEEFIKSVESEKVDENWLYINGDYGISNKEILKIDDYITNQDNLNLDVIVLYNSNYISVTRDLASNGIRKCNILVPTSDNKLLLFEVNDEEMYKLKNKYYERTITLNQFNAADGNVYAMIKHMPQKYKEKYMLNIISGKDVCNIENMVKVPLLSSVTVSGFNTFSNYPKYTYNIDIGYGNLSLKSCGLLDKKSKTFAYTPESYKTVDKVCIASEMDMLIFSAFSAIPEDKYKITGNPRNDILMISDGRKHLEKLIGRNLINKKIIFNMPTFHVHENSGITNGETINEGIKIKNFNYAKFDKLLEDHNAILISKVHHAEERLITSKMKEYKLKNILFLSNDDLDKNNLNLYEILNSADLLITDYSSIYGDFLFMDKPIIFTNSDIEQYRKERGICLEPYDFWTAGPKVQDQENLELEVIKCLNDDTYYKDKRKELRDVFYKHKDSKSTLRVWEYIDTILDNKNKK